MMVLTFPYLYIFLVQAVLWAYIHMLWSTNGIWNQTLKLATLGLAVSNLIMFGAALGWVVPVLR